jgi:hypothetical protein
MMMRRRMVMGRRHQVMLGRRMFVLLCHDVSSWGER